MELARSLASAAPTSAPQESPDAETLASAQRLSDGFANVHYDAPKPTAALSAEDRGGMIALLDQLKPNERALQEPQQREIYGASPR